MTLQLQQASSTLTRAYKRNDQFITLLDGIQSIIDLYLVNPTLFLKEQGTIEAVGVWLDLLAKRFGLERPYKNSGDSFFFGFEGNPQSTPFNQAPFRPDGDTLAGRIPLGDDVFKQLLQATTGGLRTNGQQDNINQIISEAYPGSYVVDNGNMSMTLYLFVDILPDDLEAVLLTNANIPKPAGVKLDIVEVNTFGFDGNGVGFDQGSFSYL